MEGCMLYQIIMEGYMLYQHFSRVMIHDCYVSEVSEASEVWVSRHKQSEDARDTWHVSVMCDMTQLAATQGQAPPHAARVAKNLFLVACFYCIPGVSLYSSLGPCIPVKLTTRSWPLLSLNPWLWLVKATPQCTLIGWPEPCPDPGSCLYLVWFPIFSVVVAARANWNLRASRQQARVWGADWFRQGMGFKASLDLRNCSGGVRYQLRHVMIVRPLL